MFLVGGARWLTRQYCLLSLEDPVTACVASLLTGSRAGTGPGDGSFRPALASDGYCWLVMAVGGW